MDFLTLSFKRQGIDGYTLLQMKESDLEVYLKMESLGLRKNLVRQIRQLKTLWYKQTNNQSNTKAKLAQSVNNSVSHNTTINKENDSVIQNISQLELSPEKQQNSNEKEFKPRTIGQLLNKANNRSTNHGLIGSGNAMYQ